MAKAAPAVPAVFYTRHASVAGVIDGDTISVDVDNGFHTWIRMSCRLKGIDAPEKDTIAGKAAKSYLGTILPPGTAVVVDSISIDKYGGRFDGVMWVVATGANVGETMVRTGNAKPWAVGKEKKPFPL